MKRQGHTTKRRSSSSGSLHILISRTKFVKRDASCVVRCSQYAIRYTLYTDCCFHAEVRYFCMLSAMVCQVHLRFSSSVSSSVTRKPFLSQQKPDSGTTQIPGTPCRSHYIQAYMRVNPKNDINIRINNKL